MWIDVKGYHLKVRQCRSSDYWFVYRLLKNNMHKYFERHWGGWDPKAFREGFHEDNIKIIERHGRRVGFYDLELQEDHSDINNIQLTARLQGQGIGTRIMELMEEETLEHKLHRIRLAGIQGQSGKEPLLPEWLHIGRG